MTNKGKLIEGMFKGETINTPSMLATEDCLDALNWVETIGGLKGAMARTKANFDAVAAWVEKTPWAEFLADKPETRSQTSICLRLSIRPLRRWTMRRARIS